MTEVFLVDLDDWLEQIHKRTLEVEATNGECLFAMAELLEEALTNLGGIDHRKVAEIAMIVRPMIAKTLFEGERSIDHSLMILATAVIACQNANIMERAEKADKQ